MEKECSDTKLKLSFPCPYAFANITNYVDLLNNIWLLIFLSFVLFLDLHYWISTDPRKMLGRSKTANGTDSSVMDQKLCKNNNANSPNFLLSAILDEIKAQRNDTNSRITALEVSCYIFKWPWNWLFSCLLDALE